MVLVLWWSDLRRDFCMQQRGVQGKLGAQLGHRSDALHLRGSAPKHLGEDQRFDRVSKAHVSKIESARHPHAVRAAHRCAALCLRCCC